MPEFPSAVQITQDVRALTMRWLLSPSMPMTPSSVHMLAADLAEYFATRAEQCAALEKAALAEEACVRQFAALRGHLDETV